MTCNCGNDGTPEYYITLDGVGINGFSPTVDFINSLPESFQIQVTDVDGVETSDAVPKLSYITGNYVSNDTLASTLANYSTSAEIASTYLTKTDAATTYLKVDGSNADSDITLNGHTFESLYSGLNTKLTMTGAPAYIQAPILVLRSTDTGKVYYKNSQSNSELATIGDIPDITTKLDTDGSNATNSFTINGVELAGNYVNIDSVPYGGIRANQTNSGIFYTLGVDSSRAYLTMPSFTLNAYPYNSLDSDARYTLINTTGDFQINTQGKKFYYGSSRIANNEVAIKGDIPTVSDATITLTQGGVSKGTFTLNGSATTIDLDAGGGGTTYTAGTGIDITSDVISIDTSVVAQLSDIPTSSDYVDLTTDQTVGGVKTFSSELHLNDNIVFGSSLNAASIMAKSGTSDRLLITRNNLASTVYVGNAYDALNLRGSSTRPKYYNGSSSKDLALYADIPSVMTGATSGTAGTAGLVPAPAAGDEGKVLQGDGTWVTPSSGGIQNTATGTNSLTILGTATSSSSTINIGTSSSAVGYSVVIGTSSSAVDYSVVIGNSAYNSYQNDVIIGYSAHASIGGKDVVIGYNAISDQSDSVVIGNQAWGTNNGSIAIGSGAYATGNSSNMYPATAIGYTASATASNAIQLGNGSNSTANTFAVGFDGTNYTLLDGTTGLIPDARISSNIARSANVPTSETIEAHKAYEDAGELLTDAEGLADVTKYAHSTFDKSKFTITGNPVITDNGLATGLTTNDKIDANISLTGRTKIKATCGFYFTILNPNRMVLGLVEGTTSKARISVTYNQNQNISGVSAIFSKTSSGTERIDITTSSDIPSISVGDFIICTLELEDSSTVKFTVNNVTTGKTATKTSTYNYYGNVANLTKLNCGSTNGSSWYMGTIDLKQYSITSGEEVIFSGNKTGIDVVKSDNYTVTGSPTITADGIASGFGQYNYITMPSGFLAANSWKIVYPVSKTQTIEGAMFSILGTNCLQTAYNPTAKKFFYALSSNSSSWDIANSNFIISDLDTTKDCLFVLEYTGSKYLLYVIQGDNTYEGVTINSSTKLYQSTSDLIFGNRNHDYFTDGSIDLNAFKIYINDTIFYQPCLKIPYTLSDTGSRVVSSIYRPRVADAYNWTKCAPYYTLLEGTNYTLPQGELYGMMGTRTLRDSYRYGIQYYEVYSDGTIEQGGSCSANTAVTFYKPFKDTNYVVTVPYSSKSATGFTPTQAGDWIAKGIGA